MVFVVRHDVFPSRVHDEKLAKPGIVPGLAAILACPIIAIVIAAGQITLDHEAIPVLGCRVLLPLGNGLLADPVALTKGPQAQLHRSTDSLYRTGAAVQNLSHSASLHSCEDNAPSNAGTKNLEKRSIAKIAKDCFTWTGGIKPRL